MTEITLYRPGEVSLAELSTEELREKLASSLELSASHLMHLAAIWQELERRGEDLSALRSGIAVYLPLIARGELDAQLVVRYAGQNMLLRHLAGLPREEQSRLIDDDRITIVDFVNGNFIENEVPLAEIESTRLKYVFSDHILSAIEQREIIVRRGARKPPKNLIVAEAQKAGLRSKRGDDEKLFVINVSLSAAEHARLKKYAKDNGVSIGGLMRAAIMRLIS